MQVEVIRTDDANQEKAVLTVVEETAEVLQAVELLRGEMRSVIGIKEQKNYAIEAKAIYYVEIVDNKCFLYTKNDVFESKERLYELEGRLPESFMRCSKSMIVNLKKIRNVRGEMNGRILATMLNEEEVIIARSYVKEMKRRLGL